MIDDEGPSWCDSISNDLGFWVEGMRRCFGTFLLFRVLIPSMLACIRLYRPLRGKQLSLFAADAALVFMLCGGLYLEVSLLFSYGPRRRHLLYYGIT